ncbi:hypothetical protein IWX64_002068 [Arthrobacter sp. CAN_A212]|uniref:DUF3105 domain-containing protein n=1 Tax=unclassified Arthrobacter TaxID=235627 RepID=UPI0018CA3ED1|nr:DUF3105 domain-containing protein [Arthrobacter sp. CAN_C5]MBP2214899.1 hypothetical protein [Arthrobacter sp. CAN_C5]
MNKKRAQDNADRQARLAAIQSKQRASDRKRTTLILGGIGAVVVAIIVAVTIVIVGQVRENQRIEELASQPIEGLQEFEDLSFNHIDAPVEYEQSPPVGGDHNATWTNCGVYPFEIPNENTVHSLEHGAVWITYQPDLPQAEIDALTDLVGSSGYVLLSPYADQESPVMMSAWGLQLGVDSADDDRLAVFLERYIQGEQTREPGAACSGALTPTA